MNKIFFAIILISSLVYVEAQEGKNLVAKATLGQRLKIPCLGPLIMVVGGYFYDGVEVISPGGNCSIALAAFPFFQQMHMCIDFSENTPLQKCQN